MSTHDSFVITRLATKAAALIPPCPADPLHYVEWRELVWDTARRLAGLAGDLPLTVFGADAPWADVEGTADHLLGLAALFRDTWPAARGAVAPPAEASRLSD